MISNFIGFIKGRCQIVLDDYQALRESLVLAIDSSEKEGDQRKGLLKLVGSDELKSVVRGILTGEEFGVAFRNVVSKALIDLANRINERMVERGRKIGDIREKVEALVEGGGQV